jgi:hypothetical protein
LAARAAMMAVPVVCSSWSMRGLHGKFRTPRFQADYIDRKIGRRTSN